MRRLIRILAPRGATSRPRPQVVLPRVVWLGDSRKNRGLLALEIQDIHVLDGQQMLAGYGQFTDPTPAPRPTDPQETIYFLPIAFQQVFQSAPLLSCLMTGEQSTCYPASEIDMDVTAITETGFVLRVVSPIPMTHDILPFSWFATGRAVIEEAPAAAAAPVRQPSMR